jgi:hypothetical protein
MFNPITHKTRPYILLLSLVILSSAVCTAAATGGVPDFTKGELLDPKHKKKKFYDRTLGPTGLWGQVFARNMANGASRDARQFVVTKVEAGSPADGIMQVGDVVLGAYGRNFDADARKQLAAAIQNAEETNGLLSLKVWREGRTMDKSLQLKVMGAYDPNNPFNCAYTDAVIEHMSEHAKSKLLPPEERVNKADKYPFMSSMYALGLLATGNPALKTQVRDYAHYLCIDQKTKEPITFEVSSRGKRVWHTSYHLIFLAEYYMATGDEYVLPAIKTLGIGGAKGQSGVGSYGHRFSSRKEDGSYHGPLEGYGAINNAGLSMLTGIVLASKCGVEHPEITDAIARGKRFFDFFVEHGGIPYGDHWAGTHYFENNGTSGLSAIVYGLMGDTRGQRFFSSMAVASAPTGREEGHQGSYWSYLWSDLGAARSGQAGLNAAFAETRYLRTLERGWTGQVIDQSNVGPTKYQGRGDVTGERLLLMSLGRKKLYFTGKEMAVERPLEGADLAGAIAAGRLIYHPEARQTLPEEAIFKLLRHELPAARNVAAMALKEQGLEREERLIKMLNDPDRYARYGACQAFGQIGFKSEKALELLLLRLAQDQDILFRFFAVETLAQQKDDFGDIANKVMMVLYKLGSKPVANDPRGHLAWHISEALYHKGLIRKYPPSSPREEELFIACSNNILTNPNGRARSMIKFDSLTDEQLSKLWRGIYEATRHNAPSGIMFSKGVRTGGLAAMAQHRIKEGLDAMLYFADSWIDTAEVTPEEKRWVPWFADTMFAALPMYGRDALPVIEKIEQWPVLKGRGKYLAEQLPALKKQIENAPRYELTSIK